MFPILQIGPAAVQMPGLFVILGVWVAFLLIERQAKENNLETKHISNLIFFSLLAGLVGARLGYALQFLDIYLREPSAFIALNLNTFSLPEGLLAGGFVGVVYGYRKKLPFWSTLDTLTPGISAFTIFLGLAHLSSGDAFGAPTSVPWAIELWGALRHPTQIYEIIFSTLIFLLVIIAGRKPSFPGFLFLLFISLTAASRLFLEAFRGDSYLLLDVVRRDQIIYLVILLASLIGLGSLARSESERTTQT